MPDSYEELLDDYTICAAAATSIGRERSQPDARTYRRFRIQVRRHCSIEQFQGQAAKSPSAGDVVDVMIDHGEQIEGYVCSLIREPRLRVWDNLEKATRAIVFRRVLGRVKGGLAVDVGVKHSCRDRRPIASGAHLDALAARMCR